MTASEIIDKFGTIVGLARDLGVPMTTVSSWGRFNYIPAWRQPKILELAAARGIDLSTADFPVSHDRVQPGRADAA